MLRGIGVEKIKSTPDALSSHKPRSAASQAKNDVCGRKFSECELFWKSVSYFYWGRACFAVVDPCVGSLRHRARGNWLGCSPFLNSQARWRRDQWRREDLRVLRTCRWGSRRLR